ncbi:MAG: hypothetical protein M3151_08075 [Actinomycetota bacterium]|nr:hypothetical protein [Actinomycetota bacterium]
MTHVSLALGGEVGVGLPKDVRIVTSGDTLLNDSIPSMGAPEPRGVEGLKTRCGRVLADLEHGNLVDVLPDRSLGTAAR